MAAGVTDKLWEMGDMVQVIENWEARRAQEDRRDGRTRRLEGLSL